MIDQSTYAVMPIDALLSPKPVVMAHGERVMGIVFLTLIGAVIAFVTIRNAVARRRWIIWHVRWFLLRFTLFFFASLVMMRVTVLVGFRGWWVQYLALAISSPLLFPIPPFTRSRKIPEHIRREVVEWHIKQTGGFDPKTEEIDHMVAFSKGGGHTKDNLLGYHEKLQSGEGEQDADTRRLASLHIPPFLATLTPGS
jgi:hypothetical protein